MTKEITITVPDNCELKQDGNTYTIIDYRGRLTPQGVYGFVFDRCKEIAKWKDQQFEEEKKELRRLVRLLPINETNQTIIEDLTELLS